MTSQRGITLLEVLLYIAVSAFVLLVVASIIPILLQSRVKASAISEVDSQGIVIMNKITQGIRNAEGVNSPPTASSSGSLSLDVVSVVNDPTVFDLNNGSVRIKLGANPEVELSNDNVVVSNLVFKNLSRTGTAGVIKVMFTVSRKNPENRQELIYEKTFYGSASLR